MVQINPFCIHRDRINGPPDVAKNLSGQTGGVTLASQLAELGLIDEYHFVVHPIIVGEGRRLFEGINLQEKLRLKLVESKTFKSGCVLLHYLKQ
jgi:dihydrofolate reductase